jgi:Mg-chelatase subunit ChlD/uncharacterized membrane protein
MLNYHLSFQSPWYLLLLAVLAPVWWLSFRNLAALGPVRRWLALALRSAVLGLLILALAEAQIVRVTDRLTAIFLLDQSLSIPAEQREAMVHYVNAAVAKHRKKDDRVGVIVFGRDAAIEIPPFAYDLEMTKIEVSVDPEHTNIAAAMKLAEATFAEDAARRIVVVSDGNENLGNAMEQAQGLAAAGVGVDVLPIRYHNLAEVAVERVVLPPDVRRNQPFDLRVVVNNLTVPRPPQHPGVVHGKLLLYQSTPEGTRLLGEQPVTLPPGKKVFTVRQQIDAPNFYTYEARFIPDRPEDDTWPQNNRATAFTQVQGKGQVLLIEDCEHKGEHDLLVDRLRQQGLQVTVRSSDLAFQGLADLQPFDAVVLADVPRATNEEIHFTDEQIDMLVRNTQQMGAGLIMLGGPNSFGAGGWTGTELEKAMPVDFQIQNAKVVPRGALVMLMHASEIPEGNRWQKVIAQEAIKTLGAQDYCGVIHWAFSAQWLWRPNLCRVGDSRDQMLALLDRMTPGDMPDFEPAFAKAQQEFAALQDAAVKHMIVISDGDPQPPAAATIAAMKAQRVTVSTVAVAAHGPAESQNLANIANQTGGKFYKVNNPQALPRIYQREARRVSRSLIYEPGRELRLESRREHEILGGIDALPPITGFVLTNRKDNPLVETLLVSPKPAGDRNNTILAAWPFGLGKAVAFTTDDGGRWTKQWPGDAAYDKLFGQMIRWAMRPAGGTEKFTTASEVVDDQIRVVVNALDKNDEFLNFLAMTATVIGPDLKPVPMKMTQTAPGRYVGALPARDSGSYFIVVGPGAGLAPIRTGVTVPYSNEFRDLATNEALLGQLAALAPKGGAAGKVIEAAGEDPVLEQLAAVNPFRHDLLKASSRQDIWQYLVLAGCCLFFGDVFIRRVQVNLAWVPPLAGRTRDFILRRRPPPPAPQTMDRLRSRKAEVSGQFDQLRAAARFEAPAEKAVSLDVLEPSVGRPPAGQAPPQPPPVPAKSEEESYTERLLRAKKKVWKEKGTRDQGPGTRDQGPGTRD